MFPGLEKVAGCFCFSLKDKMPANENNDIVQVNNYFTMLNIKNSAIGSILLLPFFLSSAEARYPKASKTSDKIDTFCIKRVVDKITLNGLLDEKVWMEATASKDFVRDFHLILH
jgi:hypothetical protein